MHSVVFAIPYRHVMTRGRFVGIQVFIVHHKKSGYWVFPGGHVNEGESLHDAINREIWEELGVWKFLEPEEAPFFRNTITINIPDYERGIHNNIWYLMPTDGSNFIIDLENPDCEFTDVKWLSIKRAKRIIGDPATQEALQKLETMLLLS